MPCGDATHYCRFPENTPDSTTHKCRIFGVFVHGARRVVDDETFRGLEESENEEQTSLSETRGWSPHAPYLTISQQFGDIGKAAQHDDLREVSFYLAKARMAWLAADGNQKTKQTDLRSYFC